MQDAVQTQEEMINLPQAMLQTHWAYDYVAQSHSYPPVTHPAAVSVPQLIPGEAASSGAGGMYPQGTGFLHGVHNSQSAQVAYVGDRSLQENATPPQAPLINVTNKRSEQTEPGKSNEEPMNKRSRRKHTNEKVPVWNRMKYLPGS